MTVTVLCDVYRNQLNLQESLGCYFKRHFTAREPFKLGSHDSQAQYENYKVNNLSNGKECLWKSLSGDL